MNGAERSQMIERMQAASAVARRRGMLTDAIQAARLIVLILTATFIVRWLCLLNW